LKRVPEGATVIPVVNKVDSESDVAAARAIAERVLDRIDVPRVLLTRLIADDPVVRVAQ